MIELTMQVSEFDYTETLDTFLPDLIKILSESEGVNPLIRKCVGASPEFSKKIVKGILAAMSPKQKEALTVKFLNVYASKLVAQVNEVAAKNGIVNGVAKNVFAPDASITREQIATMLYRYAGAEAAKEDKLSAFPDVAKVSDWAKEALNWAVASGLINGVADANGTANLEPQATATRAQIATILMRFCELMKK